MAAWLTLLCVHSLGSPQTVALPNHARFKPDEADSPLNQAASCLKISDDGQDKRQCEALAILGSEGLLPAFPDGGL